jgi:hypothetical protein
MHTQWISGVLPIISKQLYVFILCLYRYVDTTTVGKVSFIEWAHPNE